MRRSAKFTIGLLIVGMFYAGVIFADFLAPYDYREQLRSEPSAPATPVRFIDREGNFHSRPFIYRRELTNALDLEYTEDISNRSELHFFTRGHNYKLLGIIPSDIHLFGVEGGMSRVSILGTDALGRDRFSRLLQAIRFSLIVSPIGTLLACFIGIAVGLASGYSGRVPDQFLMGVADAMIALPALILILAARAAFPLELPPFTAASLLIGIFAAVGWAEMARLTRGLVRSARELEYVAAARATGVTDMRILTRHILPNISRPLLTQAMLMFPVFLLAEIALSFLGVGLQEPEPSLGNMLTAMTDPSLLRLRPVEMAAPAVLIFVFVLGVRLIVEGIGRRSQTSNKFR